MRPGRLTPGLLALGLIVGACSGTATTTTTLAPTTSTTQNAPATTTTTTSPVTPSSGPTSTLTYTIIDVDLEGDEDARHALAEMYGWIGDPSGPTPDVPQGLIEHLAAASAVESQTVVATLHSADVGEGRAGVVIGDEDVVLMVDEGDGWKIVGAWLPRFDLDPWFGEPLRYILVIGTDARPGQDQLNFRADSLHLLGSNISEASGGILGFPRDTYVEAPYGFDKFTHVNVYSGPNTMVELAAELSGLPVEGYVVTGFVGFQQMVDAFGGVWVDVPFAMADEKSNAYISRGLQLLWGSKALGFSRNRHIAGNDFTRSFHQGIVIAAGLEGILERDMTSLPTLIVMLNQHTWTSLSLGDLMTIAAGAFLLDPSLVGNRVLPGTITTRGGASVVVLSPDGESLYRDLDDGSLTPSG